MNSNDEISISHFINPHYFFYYQHPLRYRDANCLNDVNDRVLKFVTKEQEKPQDVKYRPCVGDFVAVLCKSGENQKWIRGQVDCIKPDIIVWASDYGKPLTATRESIISLNESDLKDRLGPEIRIGGINDILPSKMVSAEHSKDVYKCIYIFMCVFSSEIHQ